MMPTRWGEWVSPLTHVATRGRARWADAESARSSHESAQAQRWAGRLPCRRHELGSSEWQRVDALIVVSILLS